MALPARHESASSFEALYRSCGADVYAYVASLLRDRTAAEDVTALVFERALRKRRSFDRARGDELGEPRRLAGEGALELFEVGLDEGIKVSAHGRPPGAW